MIATVDKASMQERSPEVQDDLDKALRGEAYAYAKYMLYAERARASGNADLAILFENTAATERLEHFRELAELAGLTVRSDAENLHDAIAGETFETSTMYPEMAARARAVGDHQAASRFAELGSDENSHRSAYSAALLKLEGSKAGAP
jgi:rubrerythrin